MEWPSGSLDVAGDFEPRIITRQGENYTHAAYLEAVRCKQKRTDRNVCPTGDVLGWAFPYFTSGLEIFSVLRRAHRPALLEAFPAKHRPPLCGTDGSCGFLPALRAVCLRFRAHRRGVSSPSPSTLRPFSLATFAALRFVFEA